MVAYPDKLFKLIQDSDFKTVGMSVDYSIRIIGNHVYLIFQESTTKADWKVNFDFLIKPYKNQVSKMWVHRGFAKAWKSCNDIIMEDLEKTIKNHKDFLYVAVCGWSYGGAMAQLAAEDIYFRFGIKPAIVTFGAPKIFGSRSARYVSSCCIRGWQWAHKSDIVGKIPPFYSTFRRNKVGKFSLKGLFHPEKYHCCYGDKTLYKSHYDSFFPEYLSE